MLSLLMQVDMDVEVEDAASGEDESAAAEAEAAEEPTRTDAPATGAKIKGPNPKTLRSEARQASRGKRKDRTDVHCPICNTVLPSAKENTPYCPQHKTTVEAMFRQLKKDIERAEGRKDKQDKPKFGSPC